jgi:hypothetical protein
MYAARSIFAKSDVGDDSGERREFFAVGAPSRGQNISSSKGHTISFATGIKHTNAELSE